VALTGQRPLWEDRAAPEHAPLDTVELRIAPAEFVEAPDPAADSSAAEDGEWAERLQLDPAQVKTLVKRDLRAVADSRGRIGFLHPEAAVAFRAMRNAASRDGVSLRFTSAWRSWRTQDRAYRHFTETGTNLAGNQVPNVAHPDSSQHPRGLALDFALNEHVTTWLHQHAADHGWFPIPSEVWHWEYRGQDTYHAELTARPPAPIPVEDREPIALQVLL
jgi:LAS superfamily LD-carboxypeptidase LdcB